jgi:high-affinity Fe2+/Pb2+ permease
MKIFPTPLEFSDLPRRVLITAVLAALGIIIIAWIISRGAFDLIFASFVVLSGGAIFFLKHGFLARAPVMWMRSEKNAQQRKGGRKRG